MGGKPKHPPPWLFVLTNMPYGVVGSFAGTVMPYVTSNAGSSISSIGLYSTLLLVPTWVGFLYAPIVDIGPRRKHWLVLISLLGAVFIVAACVIPLPEYTKAFLACAFMAQLISGLVGSANGGLLATSMPDELRGRAGAWLMIGNLSGGALSATVVIWMIGEEFPPLVIGLTLGAMMVVSALAALAIDEPARAPVKARELFGTTLRDVRQVLFSKSGLTGIALCLSPVGTAALQNLFTALAKPYGASANTVALVNGLANTALTALGAFVGGWLCDRYNRRVLYLMSGALTAVCGLAMAISPRTEGTYAVGVMTYALITGFCYSAFAATVLETIGKGGKAASTQYALFFAAGNIAVGYTGLIDSVFEDVHGVEGVVFGDAALNIAGVVVLALVFWKLGSFGKWRHPKEPETDALPVAPPAELPTAIARITDKENP